MAIKLTSNYAKRLGLPGFSSHQFSVSVETELTDLNQASSEIARLYQSLQQSVDREIQQTGFVPGDEYGLAETAPPSRQTAPNGNGHANGNGRSTHSPNGNHSAEGAWQCSDKQRSLILDLQKQLRLSDAELDEQAQHLFSKPARQLNKLSASGLITDLLERAGKSNGRNGNNGSPARAKGGGR